MTAQQSKEIATLICLLQGYLHLVSIISKSGRQIYSVCGSHVTRRTDSSYALQSSTMECSIQEDKSSGASFSTRLLVYESRSVRTHDGTSHFPPPFLLTNIRV